VARFLFPQEDDAVLNYLDDDGFPVEPDFYAPVVPTLLINGADGIGTGWSTFVPCFNPRDLIAAVRTLLDGGEPEKLHPWYNGFNVSTCYCVVTMMCR